MREKELEAVVRGLAILGATGSIGRQTLDVVRAHPERLRVEVVSAHSDVNALLAIAKEFSVRRVAVRDGQQAEIVRDALPAAQVMWGDGALAEAALSPGVDLVVNAVVGSAGIRPTLAALDAGVDVALANKETVVAAGQLVVTAARRSGARIIPVDSEHSAIAQCLKGYSPDDVASLLLTASGGPFRTASADRLRTVTVSDALAHPTWRMGAKNTIDSATLMNKGLEVIEAHFLFSIPYHNIDVVVHPQSIIHSLVAFRDGSMLAQLSVPDMRLPIQYAIFESDGRVEAPWERLDLTQVAKLTFEAPDTARFPALNLAYRCGEAGGSYPAVMNAANEVAAMAFMAGQLDFLGIAGIVERVIDSHDSVTPLTLDDVLAVDHWARVRARALITERGRSV